MSWKACAWAKKSKTGSPARKAVLLVLADYATEDASMAGVDIPDGWSVAWPSVATLAADTELSERAVQNALAWMERHGVLRRESRHDGSGRQKSSGYWMRTESLVTVSAEDAPAVHLVHREGAPPAPPEGAPPAPNPLDTNRHLNTTTPVANVTTDRAREAVDNPISPPPGPTAAPPAHALTSEQIRARALGHSRRSGRRREQVTA